MFRAWLAGASALLALSSTGFNSLAASAEESPAGKIQNVQDCPECPPLVAIPAPSESSRDLLVARHELTWKEYIPSVREARCPLPPPQSNMPKEGYAKDLSALADDFPLTGVPPTQIGCYLNWLETRTGRKYRLPTAVEWEHLARAGTTTRFPWGDDIGFNNAPMLGRFDRRNEASVYDLRPFLFIRNMVRVESFPPNKWGLYDVVGNVEEYVANTKPGSNACLNRLSADLCRIQETRGGGVSIVMINSDGKEVVQQDPIGTPLFRSAGHPQPVGYRLVRD